MRKRVAILGSTGSIGTQALDVVSAAPERFDVVALAAGGGRPELLAAQAIEHQVEVVAVSQATAAQDVQLALYAEAQRRGWATGDHRIPRLLAGPDAATEVARTPCGP
ncbi:MAG: 1-deoxy-D-xylulose-5-phosphate reductoisomerase, partial [Actinomycetales bacterium]